MGTDKDQTQMNRHENEAQKGQGQSGQSGRGTDYGQGQGSNYGQGQGQTGQGQGQTGQGQTGKMGTHDWDAKNPGDKARGGQTDPAQPDGTTPLERNQRPINQSR